MGCESPPKSLLQKLKGFSIFYILPFTNKTESQCPAEEKEKRERLRPTSVKNAAAAIVTKRKFAK